MSKSAENKKGVIFLLDDLEVIRKKIMSATTDSEMLVKYDPENKPGISNLINIYISLTGKTIEETEKEFENSNYGEFKKNIANVVIDFVSKIQERYNELMQSDELDKILDEGIKNVLPMAKAKYEEMKKKMGLGR